MKNPSYKNLDTKRETYRVSIDYNASTIKRLLGFTLVQLSDMEYLMLAIEYEELIRGLINET